MKSLKQIWAVLLVMFLPLVLFAASAQDFQGTWEGKLTREGRQRTLTFVFQADGTSLSGKVLQDGDEFGDIQDVKLSGSTVSFRVERVDFSGVLDSDRLEITVKTPNGNSYKVRCVRVKPTDKK